ncbi:MAG: hypothetical protein OZ934_02765 [Anaerolineae bacterium]|nr:hypothetical protein [Anaerolineae bacterium]
MHPRYFRYQLAQTALEIAAVGEVHFDLEGELFSLFRVQDAVCPHSILLEIHLLQHSVLETDIRMLTSEHRLYAIPGAWIDIAGDYWVGFFNEQAKRFILFVENRIMLSPAYEAALLLIFRHITKERGTFFHGAGLQIEKRCHLFLAPSGTGKTTLSMSAQERGLPVLSDEMVFVTKKENHFVACSSPFGRITSGPLEVPLGGIFFLKQGSTTRFSRVNPSQALARAWQDSYYRDTVLDLFNQKVRFKNRIVTPAERLKVFNLWQELFSTIPCFEMEFPIDFDDWHKLAELVENA